MASNPNPPKPAPLVSSDPSPEAKARLIPASELNPSTPEAFQAEEHAARKATGELPIDPNETDDQKRERERKEAEEKNNPPKTAPADPSQRSAAGPPLRHG